MPADITLAHSETDIQGSYDQPVSVDTLCYIIKLQCTICCIIGCRVLSHWYR